MENEEIKSDEIKEEPGPSMENPPAEEPLPGPSEDDAGNGDGTEDAGESRLEITDNLDNIVEAMLFAADEPLTAMRIKEILGLSIEAKELRKVVTEINRKLSSEHRPFEIAEVAGGFQYRTVRAYQKYLKALFKDRAMRRLSGQALETLAIIAYKQPASKAEIEGIRNVSTDTALKTLLEKRLISILGKSEEKPGKPIVYGTTRDFLKYFGLGKISDLPKMEEMEDIARAQEKSELIHDFKRDPEKTHTLTEEKVPAAVEGAAPEAAASEETAQEDLAQDPAPEEAPPFAAEGQPPPPTQA